MHKLLLNILSHKTYVALFLGGFAACYLLVPAIRYIALKLEAFDPPSERRVHKRRIPTLGGLAIAIPLYAGLALLYIWPNVISNAFFAAHREVLALVLGGLVILALGIYDDLRGASAYMKFPFQILAAMVVCALAGPIRSVSIPFFGQLPLGVFAVPATVFWIVAITNAFNLIDGVDGLATGVGLVVCGVSFFLAAGYGHIDMMVFTAIMSGALLAFLRYNFHPASIFLGDTGSLLIGFTIAVVALNSSMKAPTTVAILVPLCALGYPLMDLGLAVARRFLKGRPLFRADRSHIHHKLLASGLDHRGASVVAYGFTVLFTGIGILHILGRNAEAGILLVGVLVVLTVLFKIFGYWDYLINNLSLSLRKRYRMFHQAKKATVTKIEQAEKLEDLWNPLCRLAQKYDLHTVRLHLDGGEPLVWEHPDADGQKERSVREFDFPRGSGRLRISHNGHKGEDIEFEQNILLEETSRKLGEKVYSMCYSDEGENTRAELAKIASG